MMRKNEHHTEEERRDLWKAAKKETLLFPAYALLWLYKKSGLEKWRRRRLTQRNPTFTPHA
jgi:hypothetical protein